jgi:hypothetical protein
MKVLQEKETGLGTECRMIPRAKGGARQWEGAETEILHT